MRDDPPRYGSVPLVTGEEGFGAAFEMSAKAPSDAEIELDGWTVCIRAGSKSVVAYCADPTRTWAVALEAAQRGLDVACVRDKIESRIEGAEWTRVVWCSTDGQLSVEIVDVGRSRMSVGAVKITVSQPDGTVVPPPARRLEWAPHLRYFRHARTTTDLADAYRNLILALEAVLSSQSRPADREGERAWLRRALEEVSASGFDLRRFVTGDAQDVVAYLIEELYEKQRHPLFHAKVGRSVTLPSPSSDVSNELHGAVRTLTDLYLALVRHISGIRWPAGFVSPAVIEGPRKLLTGKPVCYTADDSVVENDTATSPTGLPVFELGRSARAVDADAFSAVLETRGVVEDAVVRRLCLTDDDGKPLIGLRLEEPLVLPNRTSLTVVCGLHFLNELDAYRRFST